MYMYECWGVDGAKHLCLTLCGGCGRCLPFFLFVGRGVGVSSFAVIVVVARVVVTVTGLGVGPSGGTSSFGFGESFGESDVAE